MKRARGTLLGEFLGGGACRSKVENQNVHPAKELPDRFVVMRGTSVLEMCAESLNEAAHPLVGRALAIDAIHERSRISDLPRPGQDVLIRAVDIVGRA